MIIPFLQCLMGEKNIDDSVRKHKLAFQEIQDYFNYLSDANDELDKKIFTLFSSINIILAILGLIGFDFSEGISCVEIIIITFLIIVFLNFCFWSIWGLFPRKADYPYDGSYEGAKKIFFDKPTLSDSYKQIISNYENNLIIIKRNNKLKDHALKVTSISYLVIIVLALLIIFLG